MKYTIEQIPQGENELVLKYCNIDDEVEQILKYFNRSRPKLVGKKDGAKVIIQPSEILYIESVDGNSFVYLQNDVLEVDFSLAQLEEILNSVNFFRCSKSVIINIDMVHKLKSLASNRIDATMRSGEHIMISRTYASDFRKRLKGVNNHE